MRIMKKALLDSIAARKAAECGAPATHMLLHPEDPIAKFACDEHLESAKADMPGAKVSPTSVSRGHTTCGKAVR